MRRTIARILRKIAEHLAPESLSPMEYRPGPGCELVSIRLEAGSATVNVKTADASKPAEVRLDTIGSVNMTPLRSLFDPRKVQPRMTKHGAV